MPYGLANKAGYAILWKAAEHGGVKGIFLVRLLILARLLTPDDFGLLAVSMVAVSVMSGLTDVGMVPALIQRPVADSRHYDVAWTVGLLRAVLIASVVVVVAPWVAELFGEPRATVLIQVLAVQPILEASASIRVADLTRTLRFKRIACIKLAGGLANTLVAISLASRLGVWSLVAGALSGPLVGLVVSYLVAPYRPRIVVDTVTARSLVRFGRWIFLIGIIGVAGSSVLRWVITRQLGTAELGVYYLAASLAFLPSEISGQVIGQVTFPLYARLQQERERVGRAFRSVLKVLLAILGPGCALLISLAPALVDHVLGPRWQGTVPVIRILATINIIGLLGESVAPILKGVGRPDKLAVTVGTHTLLLIALAWVFTDLWGLAGAALAWLPSVAMSQIIVSKYARDVLARPFAGLAKPVGVILSVSCAGGVVSFVAYELYPTIIGLVLVTCIASVCMGLLLWAIDHRVGLGDDVLSVFPRAGNTRVFKFLVHTRRSGEDGTSRD